MENRYVAPHKINLRYDLVSQDRIRLFHDKINISLITGCWNWTGAHKKTRGSKKPALDYGSFSLGGRGRVTTAHRASWLIHFGEIPDGMNVCHSCDNPRCCNPDHLFLGTTLDNVMDKIKKGRGNVPRGSRNHFARLSEAEVRKIKEFLWGGSTVGEVAKIFNRSYDTIFSIKNGSNWAWVK